MKRSLLLVVALCLLSSWGVSAQKRGDMYIGGSAGLAVSAQFVDGISAAGVGVEIAPEFGYFVNDHLKLGANLGYAYQSEINILTLGPDLTYYIPLCEGLYYTPGVTCQFAMAIVDGMGLLGVGAGLNLFALEFRPTKHFGFSASVVSLTYVGLFKSYASLNTVSFGLGVSPSVGFKYYF